MNAWEFNKMVGAFLGTLLFGMALGLLAEAIFEEHPPEQPGYQIAIAEPAEGDDAAAPEEEPFAALLAKADPQSGQRAAAACQACHSFGEGEPNKVGPNLYGVVGAEVLHVADFNYSSAMREWGAGKRWNYEELDHFLEDPQGYIPGTIMGYAGIKDNQRRADVIAYLKSISPDAPPLPEPPAQTASTDAAADTTGTDAATTDAATTDAATTDAATTDAAATDAATTDAATTDAATTDAATTDAATTDAATTDAATTDAATTDAATTDAATTETAATDAATTDADGAATPAAPADDTAATAQAGDAAGAGTADPFVALVAAADPARAERDAAICKACHTFEEGGPNRVGPNLDGTVGGAIVHSDSFAYSDAMKAYAGEHGTWTVGLLNGYLDAPMQTVPGTKMAFAGVKDEQRRASIVAYLRSISPDAPPLEEAAAPAAPTTDTAAAPPTDATATDAAPSDASPQATDTQDAAAATGTPDAAATDAPDAAAASDTQAAAPATDTQDQAAAPSPTEDAGATDAPADATTDAAAEETTPAASTPAATDAEPSAGEPPPAAAAATETSDGAETASGGDQTRDAADAVADPAGDGETEVAAAAPGDTTSLTGDAASATGDGAAPASDAFARLVAASSPDAGRDAARICSACHSFEEGGANKVGPNLYGVVGGKVLLSDDYNYSAAMKEFAAEHPTWTIALLDEYLEAPLKVVPGTKMAFAGIPDENRRAEVIAFLRSLSADPVPIAGADE